MKATSVTMLQSFTDDAEQEVLCNIGLLLEVEAICHPRGFNYFQSP
jgi:hypothetical protein